MIKVILWDIDGTLLNFKEAEKYAIRKCFSAFGLGDCPDDMLKRYSAINAGYWKRLEAGEITKERVLLGRFEEFFQREGFLFEKVREFNEEYQLRLGDTVCFNDEGYELVKRLSGRVRQYAVTNGTCTAQKRKLKLSGLDKLFDDVFISDEIGTEKPGKGFFDAVWARIGPCSREEALLVGDSLTSDMQGAVNAGISGCWYNPGAQENDTGLSVDHEIRNLWEIMEILRGANRRERS